MTVPAVGPTAVDLPAWRWRYIPAPSDQTSLFYEARVAVEIPLAGEGNVRPPPLPLALCDGIGCDGYIWRYLAKGLPEHALVHPHYRGHGRSAMPRDPARIEIPDLADDLVACLDDAGIDQAILMGHSMGVQVALETYRRYPDRVAGLVLLCGAPGSPLKTFAATSSLEDLLPRIQGWLGKTPMFANWVSRQIFPTRLAFEVATRLEISRELVDPRDFMPYLVGMSQLDTRLFVAMLQAIGRHSADDLLPDIRVPTLVVAGDQDGFTPPSRSRDMAEHIPGATLVTVANGSHTAPIERPAFVCDAVRNFLGGISGTDF